MSYSRWSNSSWYTFWCSSNATKREEEIFSICSIREFSYRDFVEEGIDFCIEELKKSIEESNKKNKMFSGGIYTDKDYEELKEYMQMFVDDVKNHYDTPSQRYHDGDITLEDAFIEEI